MPDTPAISQQAICATTKQRVIKALEECPTIQKKVVHHLQIAAMGTQPSGSVCIADVDGNCIPVKKAHLEVCMYRIIYSTPEIKREIEKHVGESIGNAPPFLPSLLALQFNSAARAAEAEAENQADICHQRQVLGVRTIIFALQAGLLVFPFHDIPESASVSFLFAIWCAVFCCSIIYLRKILDNHLRRTQDNEERKKKKIAHTTSCACCVCGMSSNGVGSQQFSDDPATTAAAAATTPTMAFGPSFCGDNVGNNDDDTASEPQSPTGPKNASPYNDGSNDSDSDNAVSYNAITQCENCNDTGVCKVGCKTCCPYFISPQIVEKQVCLSRVLKTCPDLQQRFQKEMKTTVSKVDGPQGAQHISHILEVMNNNNAVLSKEVHAAIDIYKHTLDDGKLDWSSAGRQQWVDRSRKSDVVRSPEPAVVLVAIASKTTVQTSDMTSATTAPTAPTAPTASLDGSDDEEAKSCLASHLENENMRSLKAWDHLSTVV